MQLLRVAQPGLADRVGSAVWRDRFGLSEAVNRAGKVALLVDLAQGDGDPRVCDVVLERVDLGGLKVEAALRFIEFREPPRGGIVIVDVAGDLPALLQCTERAATVDLLGTRLPLRNALEDAFAAIEAVAGVDEVAGAALLEAVVDHRGGEAPGGLFDLFEPGPRRPQHLERDLRVRQVARHRLGGGDQPLRRVRDQGVRDALQVRVLRVDGVHIVEGLERRPNRGERGHLKRSGRLREREAALNENPTPCLGGDAVDALDEHERVLRALVSDQRGGRGQLRLGAQAVDVQVDLAQLATERGVELGLRARARAEVTGGRFRTDRLFDALDHAIDALEVEPARDRQP